jgi:hypothetical protein
MSQAGRTAMFLSSLDKWDERQASEDDRHKRGGQFVAGASLAFSEASPNTSIDSFIEVVKARCTRSMSFYLVDPSYRYEYRFEREVLAFQSAVVTETPSNNMAYARVRESRGRRNAIIILPHWNAPAWSYARVSDCLAYLGVTTIEMMLPYQGPRRREGSKISDYLLSANLGLTIRSFRQAVIDTRLVIDWLVGRGYDNIALLGISIGSCIAGLVSAHDVRVRGSALLLTAGDFAEVVWTGRATQHIRRALQPVIDLERLKVIWSIVSPALYARSLSRDGHKLLIVSGARDQVVQAYLTQRLVDQLRAHRADCEWRRLPCGHYSLALWPFNVLAFTGVLRFLRQNGFLWTNAKSATQWPTDDVSGPNRATGCQIP